jgi:hypothetical protein
MRLVRTPYAIRRKLRLVWRCQHTSGHGRRLCIVTNRLKAAQIEEMGRLVEILQWEPYRQQGSIKNGCSSDSVLVSSSLGSCREQYRGFLNPLSPLQERHLAFEGPYASQRPLSKPAVSFVADHDKEPAISLHAAISESVIQWPRLGRKLKERPGYCRPGEAATPLTPRGVREHHDEEFDD